MVGKWVKKSSKINMLRLYENKSLKLRRMKKSTIKLYLK